MKISIAMCTFNGAVYLENQLASIQNQVRLPDEIIICDDGSYDDTLNILQSFSSQAPFQTYIYPNKKRLGIKNNFEKAIRLCSGDVIVLSDQDDIWDPQKLVWIEQEFLKNPKYGGIFTNAEVVNENLKPLGFSLWKVINFSKKEQALVQNGKALDVLLKHMVATGATLAFRAQYKDMIIPIPSCWMHDAWIALNLSVFSNLSIIQEKLILYRQHGNNQIGGMPKGIGFRIKETLAMDRDVYYSSELERYQFAQKHFSKWFSPDHEKMKKISSKIQHLKIRSRLPVRRSLRILFILEELLKGNYHQYSVNWQVAVRDLLIP